MALVFLRESPVQCRSATHALKFERLAVAPQPPLSLACAEEDLCGQASSVVLVVQVWVRLPIWDMVGQVFAYLRGNYFPV